MIKRLVFGAAVGALALAPLSARADGFYLNPEFNAGWTGSDFNGSVLEGHVGYEKGGLYIQGGPAYLQPDGGDAEVGLSGKMGINAPVSESFDVYGEVSAAKFDDVDAGYGLKVGGKYSF
jgi:hypothetical protein